VLPRPLEDEEWSLLNASSDLVTKAVGLVLDETAASVDRIQASTAAAERAVRTLHDVRKVIDVATAAVGLGAAIVSKDPGHREERERRVRGRHRGVTPSVVFP
jgi:hypothetical protein